MFWLLFYTLYVLDKHIGMAIIKRCYLDWFMDNIVQKAVYIQHITSNWEILQFKTHSNFTKEFSGKNSDDNLKGLRIF
jgi:hypothetical protein